LFINLKVFFYYCDYKISKLQEAKTKVRRCRSNSIDSSIDHTYEKLNEFSYKLEYWNKYFYIICLESIAFWCQNGSGNEASIKLVWFTIWIMQAPFTHLRRSKLVWWRQPIQIQH